MVCPYKETTDKCSSVILDFILVAGPHREKQISFNGKRLFFVPSEEKKVLVRHAGTQMASIMFLYFQKCYRLAVGMSAQ